MPWRASCRAHMRARTLREGWRSSKANIMRLSTAGQVRPAEFDVHNVGTVFCSSIRFMYTFDPRLPPRRPVQGMRCGIPI